MKHLIIVTTTALTAVAASGFLLPYRVEHSEIATATPEQAWKTITDLQNHPTWNPNVVRLEGQPVVGTRLINRTRSDTTEMTFHPEMSRTASCGGAAAWACGGWPTASTTTASTPAPHPGR